MRSDPWAAITAGKDLEVDNMAEKPRFGTIEQRTAPQGARANLNFNPMGNSQIWAQIGNSIGQAGEVLGEIQNNYDNLKMQDWEEQLNTQYKQMNNQLSASQNPEEYDSIVKNTVKQMKDKGRGYLGDRLFNRWERDYGGNYYTALQADVEGKKITLLQRLGYQTAQETVRQKAYSYGYAPEPQKKQMDDDFKAYLEINHFSPMQKKELAAQYDKQKTDASLTYLLDTDPQKIAYINEKGKVISPMNDEKQFSNLTIEEKIRWREKALEVQRTEQEQLKKGWDLIDSRQFSLNKAKLAGLLDLSLERMKNAEEVTPAEFFSFLNQIDDLTTKEKTGYVNKDGSVAFYLEPNEYYQYQKDVLKYFDDVIEQLDKPDQSTYFSYGLSAIDMEFDKFAKSHGLNEFDRMDITQEYYRQMAATVPNMMDGADIAYQPQTMEAAQKAFSSFVMRSKKFNEREKNIVLTTPATIKRRYITQEGWEELKEEKQFSRYPGTVRGTL